MRTSFVALVLILGVLISQSAISESFSAPGCIFRFQTISDPKYDSSIEIELSTQPKVLRLFTTPDEMISGILQGKALPPELIKNLKKEFPEFWNKISRIPWDKLNPETQRKIVAWVHQDQDFQVSRFIQGLVPKESIKIYIEKPTSIFGKKYEIGWNDLPLREILGKEPLHFTSPKSMTDFSIIEMHFRQKVNPSRNLEEAWNLLDVLKIDPVPFHQHVVGKWSPENFRPNLIIESSRLIEFHRRLNLYTEMLRILDKKPIETISENNDIFFDSLKQERLQSDFMNTFMSLYSPTDKRPSRNPAYVCLRLPGTYDGNEPVYGFEFRTLSKKSPPLEQEKLKKLMDSTQYAMTHHEYGLPKKKFEQWIRTEVQDKSIDQDILQDASEEKIKKFLNNQIKNLYYSKNIDYPFLKDVLGQKNAQLVYNRLVNAPHVSNQAISMLTHDWSHDPLLFEDMKAQAKIREIQVNAVKRLFAGENPRDTLIFFLKKSSFFKIIEDSLGVI